MSTANNLPTSKNVVSFVRENWVQIMFTTFGAIAITLLSLNILAHKEEVQTIAQQNVGCIYLEKSQQLSGNQHYLICDGKIFLKRVAEQVPEQPVEEKLEKVLPAEPTNPTTK